MHRFLIAEYVPISALCDLIPAAHPRLEVGSSYRAYKLHHIETVDGDPITLHHTLQLILFLVRVAVAAPLRSIDQQGLTHSVDRFLDLATCCFCG